MFTPRRRPEEDISQRDDVQVFFSSETELPPRLAVELVTRLEMLIVRHARCHLGQRGRARQPPPVPPCHPSSRLTHRGSVASVTVTCLSVESDRCPSDASNLARGISVSRPARCHANQRSGWRRAPPNNRGLFFFYIFFFYSCRSK